MALLPRSLEDILLDRIQSALESFRNEQIAIDPSVDFDVFRDRTRPYLNLEKASVNIWSDGNEPQGNGKAYSAEEFQIILDCMVPGQDTLDYADKVTAARLYYLKEQVRYALYRLVNFDFGFDPGIISSKKRPKWTRYLGQDNMPEETIAGGRWTMAISYAWEAEDVAGVPLDELSWQVKLSKLGQIAGAGAANVQGLEEYPTA